MQTEYVKLVRANGLVLQSGDAVTIDTHGLLARIKVTSGSLSVQIPSEKEYNNSTWTGYAIEPNEEISFCGCIKLMGAVPGESIAKILFYDKI